MIGQHIYSRCLTGYFSKTSGNADSTTVTIDKNMFAREDQAQKIAMACEQIAVLEDSRPVPDQLQGAYRGVLKIRRLNKLITVVCRSFRLHSSDQRTQAFTGDFRDFSFGTSYLLIAEHKNRFLTEPESCLNIGDFEDFNTVVERAEQSRSMGMNGKIEANSKYSLFRSPVNPIGMNVFSMVGFNRKLFADYISGILEKIAYLDTKGREREKVVVLLPLKYNPSWNLAGGNIYAEQVMTATIKILPYFVREKLSAISAAGTDPSARLLDGYQLVFMEGGDPEEWKRQGYTVIDLERQESYVTKDLDTAYGQFLWDNLTDTTTRTVFEEKYTDLFGKENVEKGENYPEKFGFVLRMQEPEEEESEKTKDFCIDLIEFSEDKWTDTAKASVANALSRELENPKHDLSLANALAGMAARENCPEELKTLALQILIDDIFYGNAEENIIQLVVNELKQKNGIAERTVLDHCLAFGENIQPLCMGEHSLRTFLHMIVQEKTLAENKMLRDCMIDVHSELYDLFWELGNEKQCGLIARDLALYLKEAPVSVEQKKEICKKLNLLLFQSSSEIRKKVASYIRTKILKEIQGTRSEVFFWNGMQEQFDKGMELNEEVISFFTYYAFCQDEYFQKEEWEEEYKNLIRTYGKSQKEEVFDLVLQNLLGWSQVQKEEEKKKLSLKAAAMVMNLIIQNGAEYDCIPDLKEIRSITKILDEHDMCRESAELIYRFYQRNKYILPLPDGYSSDSVLKGKEACRILLLSEIYEGNTDSFKEYKEVIAGTREQMYSCISECELKEKAEITAAAKIYFNLMKIRVMREISPLCGWCQEYKKDSVFLNEKQSNAAFVETLRKYIRAALVKESSADIKQLKPEYFKIIRELGISSKTEGWEFLEILYNIYRLKDGCSAKAFYELRKNVLSESDPGIRDVYAYALSNKRAEISNFGMKNSNETSDLAYHLALMECQYEDVWKDKQKTPNDTIIQTVARKVFMEINDEEKDLLTAMKLLHITDDYLLIDIPDPDRYIQATKEKILRTIKKTAKEDRRQFCYESIANAYRALSENVKDELKREGFHRALQKLSKEWLDKYEAGRKIHKMQKIQKIQGDFLVPAIIGIVTAVLCSILLFLSFAGIIGYKTEMFAAVILVILAIAGGVTVLVLTFRYGNDDRDGNDDKISFLRRRENDK